MIENVLEDDEKQYKALQPNFDFLVNGGAESYIASIKVQGGDTGPQNMEVYVSNVMDSWTLVKKYSSSKEKVQNLIIPGEHICKFVRLRCVNNIRGGNLVSVKHIQINGLPRD